MSNTPWLQRVQIGDCTLYQGDCLAVLDDGKTTPDDGALS